MKDLKTYPEGTPFTGRIGRTAATSEAAWPLPQRARRPARPTCSCSCSTTWASRSSAASARTSARPTFDRLAAGGLRYRDFHTTAICSPTRACLLTGRNHHSNGVGIIQEMATGFPGYNGMVPRENGFLSEMLLAQGYATLGIGKWHLTLASEYASGASKARWPLSRGFERFYGFIGGKTNQWAPTLVHDSHYIDPPRRPEEGYHLNADLADHAIEYLTDLRTIAPDKPFFMYYCLGAGHAPHHVEPEWIERYRGKFDQGWDRWREEVFARQLAMGIVPPGTKLSPRPPWVKAWDTLVGGCEAALRAADGGVRRRSSSRPTITSAACIDFLERAGRARQHARACWPPTTARRPKAASTARSTRTSSPTASSRRSRRTSQHLDDWGSVRSFPNYSWGWAWAGNTPLRRWKRYLHQGGMSDPLIVHWPKGIARARRGARPVRARGRRRADDPRSARARSRRPCSTASTQRPLEGVSFAHTFNDAAAPTRKEVQYYEMIASRALWADGWKAVVEQPQGDPLTDEMLAQQKWELYHVEQRLLRMRRTWPTSIRRSSPSWSSAGGSRPASTTCCRSIRGCSCGWASASRAPCPPATATCTTRAARRSSNTRRSTSRTARTRSRPKSRFPPGGAEGVLLAHGSWFAGYSLYVKDRRLVYVHNHLGLAEYRIASTEDIAAGQGDARGSVSPAPASTRARRALRRRAPDRRRRHPAHGAAVIETSGEGLCCGYDSGLPVTHDYRAPFRFTGRIEQVVVEIDDAPAHRRGGAAARAC